MNKKFKIFNNLFKNDTLLYINVGLLALVDVMSFVSALIIGNNSMIAMTSVLMCLSIGFFLITLESNFHFKYSILVPVLYAIMFILFGYKYISIVEYYSSVLNYFIYFGVRVVLLGSSIYLMSSITKNKTKTLLGTIIHGAILIAFVGLFGFNIFTQGIFGQAPYGKQIHYSYNESGDYYIATEYIPWDGNHSTSIILDKFNGKPVKVMYSNLFEDVYVNNLIIKNGDIEVNVSTESDFDYSPSFINVPEGYVMKFANQLLDIYKSNKNGRKGCIDWINAVRPIVEEDEVYVTFSYTADSLEKIGCELFDIWITPKGKTFEFAQVSRNVDFLQGYDIDDEDYLRQCYDNQQGQVLNDLVDKKTGKSIINEEINDFCTVVVDFIYINKVKFVDDNDTLFTSYYELEQNNGYHYFVDKRFNILSDNITHRAGFEDVCFNYGLFENELNFSMTLYEEVSEIIQYPNTTYMSYYWEMLNPTIEMGEVITTYGDSHTLEANFEPSTNEACDFVYNFTWSFPKASKTFKTTTNSLYISKSLVEYGGTCSVSVQATSPTSSLHSSNVSVDYSSTVNPKEVTLVWNTPNKGSVYKGSNYTVSCVKPEGVFLDDDFDIQILEVNNLVSSESTNQLSFMKAAQYNFLAAVDCNYNKYDVKNKTVSVTIDQKELNVVWDESTLEYTYDASKKTPKFSLASSDICSIDQGYVTGKSLDYKIYAGSYPLTAQLVDNENSRNYKLTDTRFSTLVINKREITFVDNYGSYVYDGEGHFPDLTRNGIVNNDPITIDYTYVGIPDQVGIHNVKIGFLSGLRSENYFIDESFVAVVEIVPRVVELSWSNCELTYNGKTQYPTITIDNICGKDDVTVLCDGYKKAGSYTSNVLELSGNDASNYTLSSATNTSHSFTINKLVAKFEWIETEVTYNGEIQFPTFEMTNKVDTSMNFKYDQQYKDANTSGYTISVSILGNSNYTIDSTSNASCIFKINPLPIKFNWSNKAFVYDGTSKLPTVTAGNLIGTDQCTFDVTGQATNPGEYTASISNLSNSNYVIDTTTNSTCKFRIEKRTLNISWNAPFTFEFDGQNHSPSFELSNMVGSDNPSVECTSASIVGTHTAKLTINSNYYELDSSNTEHEFTITQKELDIDWSNITQSYTGEEILPVAELKGLVSGFDNVYLIYDQNYIEVGEHQISATLAGTDANNYCIKSGSETCTLTIN